MSRQQRRYLERELEKCARGMAYISSKKDIDVVDHNHHEFLKYKAERLRGKINENNG